MEDKGINALVLEASNQVSGRVRTDSVAGFRLDHGFQFFLTAFPEAKKLLDYEKLDFVNLSSGARIRNKNNKNDFFRDAEPALNFSQSLAGTLANETHLF